jgi:hypothetical protein
MDAACVQHDHRPRGHHPVLETHARQEEGSAVLAGAVNQGPHLDRPPGHGEQVCVQLTEVQDLTKQQGVVDTLPSKGSRLCFRGNEAAT